MKSVVNVTAQDETTWLTWLKTSEQETNKFMQARTFARICRGKQSTLRCLYALKCSANLEGSNLDSVCDEKRRPRNVVEDLEVISRGVRVAHGCKDWQVPAHSSRCK